MICVPVGPTQRLRRSREPKAFRPSIRSPLDIAIDAHLSGPQIRFTRNGCHPNAVLYVAIKKTQKTPLWDMQYSH